MLSPYVARNFKMLRDLKPSLLLTNFNHSRGSNIDVILYIPISDNSSTGEREFEVLGTVSAVFDNALIISRDCEALAFTITGTSAAYPGLGSLLYQSLMIHINEVSNNNGYLISDRGSITGRAEKLYEKMDISKGFESINIPVESELYSRDIECDCLPDYAETLNLPEDLDYDDYLEGLKSGDYPHSHLNKAFKYHPDKQMTAIFNHLRKQGETNKLDKAAEEAIFASCEEMNYYVEDNLEVLQERVRGGFSEYRLGHTVAEPSI